MYSMKIVRMHPRLTLTFESFSTTGCFAASHSSCSLMVGNLTSSSTSDACMEPATTFSRSACQHHSQQAHHNHPLAALHGQSAGTCVQCISNDSSDREGTGLSVKATHLLQACAVSLQPADNAVEDVHLAGHPQIVRSQHRHQRHRAQPPQRCLRVRLQHARHLDTGRFPPLQ